MTTRPPLPSRHSPQGRYEKAPFATPAEWIWVGDFPPDKDGWEYTEVTDLRDTERRWARTFAKGIGGER